MTVVEIGHPWTKRQSKAVCQYVISMRYDLTPSCMKATRDVTAKFSRHRRILWVSEQLCSVSRLILGILHFYYAFLIYKYTMYNIPEMTWVPVTSTLRPPQVRDFVKNGYFFVPRYEVYMGQNPLTIHEIYAALTPSDSWSDCASEIAAATCYR